MTIDEAVKHLQGMRLSPVLVAKLTHGKSAELTDYCNKQLNAIQMGIDALIKQIPKSIEVWNGQYTCPACEILFGDVDDIDRIPIAKRSYCHKCGQALDWSEHNAEG